MKNKLFYYRNLIVIVLFIFVFLVKLNFIFFSALTLHSSIQSMLEPYSKALITKALPGFELQEESESLFRSPVDVLESFLAVAYPVNSGEPASYFAVQFVPIRNNHSEVLAMLEEGEGVGESEPSQAAYFPDERSYRDVVAEIDEIIENGEIEARYGDDLTDIDEIETYMPKVLIYHSHTTESFVPTSGNAFSENPEESIVKVGQRLAEGLESLGLETIHNTDVHDLPTRHESYVRSLETVENILEEHPQIEMVIDLHRDGVRREMTTVEIDGEKYGKILLLVGSRDNHPDWKQNYGFANYIKDGLKAIRPELLRGVKTRRFSYNQEVHPHSVLIEVGGHENSIEEAKRSIPYLSKAMVEAYMKITNLDSTSTN